MIICRQHKKKCYYKPCILNIENLVLSQYCQKKGKKKSPFPLLLKVHNILYLTLFSSQNVVETSNPTEWIQLCQLSRSSIEGFALLILWIAY
jgi:hypothetical protein